MCRPYRAGQRFAARTASLLCRTSFCDALVEDEDASNWEPRAAIAAMMTRVWRHGSSGSESDGSLLVLVRGRSVASQGSGVASTYVVLDMPTIRAGSSIGACVFGR